MSSSPVSSPVGKKLKTMDDEDQSSVTRLNCQQQERLSSPAAIIGSTFSTNRGSQQRASTDTTPSDHDDHHECKAANLSSPMRVLSDGATPGQEGTTSDKLAWDESTLKPSSSIQSDNNVTLPSRIEPATEGVGTSSGDRRESRSKPRQGSVTTDDEDHDCSAHSPSDTPRIVAIGDDLADSETTGHSPMTHDYMDTYSENSDEDDLVFLDNVTDSSDEDSSGYMGYENAVAGRYYYDNEEDSLDMESDEEENDGINHYSPEEYLKYDPTPDNPYPKPDWATLNELRARKCGFASSKNFRRGQNPSLFERYASNSLWAIQRLQVVRKLQHHSSCVNSLDFSSTANLICSGGDDLDVCIWDWRRDSEQLRAEICTGHNNNVFQTVFCNRDTNIVTSSRDGSCRLVDIETERNEKLMSSTGEIQKLAFISEDTFLTCGTNASVNMLDLRTREAKKLFTVRSPKSNQTCQLHSINSHPLDRHLIAVAGKSPYVFLYDLRRPSRELHDSEIKPTYNLGNLENSDVRVTSTAFNSTGDKLLISYNDDDLFVCRTDTCKIIHRYQGHRNKKTYKGCAWFGDNFVLSGSDDGHIYGWDLESEHIVCFLQGDRGVVNCLLVHPTLPVLASSGLEDDIKVWEPIADVWPQTMKGIKPQICKNTLRRKLARQSRYLMHQNARIPSYDEEDTTDEQEGRHESDEDWYNSAWVAD